MHRATIAVIAVLGLPAIGLLMMVVFLLHSADRVEYTEKVIAEVHLLEKTVLDMETGLRGFELTGDARFLEPLAAGEKGLNERLNSLSSLVEESSTQSVAAQRLRLEILRWEYFSQEALALQHVRGETARDINFELRGKRIMDSFRDGAERMIETETRLLGRQTLFLHRARMALFIAMALFVVPGIPLALKWLRRLLRRASDTYRASLVAAEIRANELHVALRSIGDAVVTTNATGEVIFLNPVAERLMGWPNKEAYGRPLVEVFKIFNEYTGAPSENPVVRVLRERIVVGLANHTVLRSRNGQETPIEDSAAPIIDDAGEMHGVILVFHDVAKKRQVERQLADAEWRSRVALEIGDACAWVWEIEQDLVSGDAMLSKLFGVPLEKCLAGEKIAVFFHSIHEGDRARAMAAIQESISSGQMYQADYRVRGEDGVVRWIHARGRMELNEAGKPGRVISFLTDITTARQTEQTLKESEQLFRFLNEFGECTRKLSDPREILTTAARLLGEHLRVSRCAYAHVETDSEHFTIRGDYTNGCASTVGDYRLSLFGSRAVAEMRGGRTLVIRDVDLELTADSGAEMFNAIAVKAIVCCPLIKEGALRAMMAVHQITPRDWTPYEITLVEEVVERCWATIERARAEAEIREQARLSALRADIAAHLAFGDKIERILQSCCQRLVDHLDAALARVWTLNPKEAVLELRASAGVLAHLDGPHSRIPVGQAVTGRIAQSQQPYTTDDVSLNSNFKDPEWLKSEGIKAFAGYPLIVEGRLIGVFAIFSCQTLSDAVLADLTAIADGISQCIERKRAESALHASENLKSAILDTSLDGFVLMDHEGIIVDWNPAAERIFRIPRPAAVGQSLGDTIVPVAMRERHRSGLQRYMATREARILGRRYEMPALRADGEEFSCEISITHIPGTEPPLFAGYLRDISERKQAEAELHAATERAEAGALAVAESAERFRLLAEVVSLQVWTARLDGELDFANQECVQYFGAASEEDLLGNKWAEYVHHADLPEALSLWQSALGSGQRYEVEFRLRGADGTFRWFLVRAAAMRDEESRIAKWFGTNTDIHALKMAQDDAERASRAKDAFLAALSHELRTPLTPVLMTAASLREDERLPADTREQLRMMERNIALEARLIDDLLDLTRIARGKLYLRPQSCDAHSLIEFAVEIVRDDVLAKHISFQREFGAVRSGISTDPARFQQVIWNLLRNAVKFTPRGGQISIHTRDKVSEEGDHWLCIEVTDSGIGIEPALLNEIFLPFEQGGLTGDHRFGGMGLGLSIARAIIDLHGGAITAYSAGLNCGAMFRVELPGAGEPPHGVAETAFPDFGMPPSLPPAPQDHQERRSLRLLLVEDHEPTLQVLSRLLLRAGHHVVTASSVRDGLHAASGHTFDLVISDLGLPDGSGTELMVQLRDTHRLRGIALSGYGMEEDIVRSREAGFELHLIKPVDFKQLQSAIFEMLAVNP
ncbi:MAG: domain S-box [Chthoniobacteraceae bacterium]|nr:domain S-box [Chthoniobacteraceae bacterium]